MSRTTEPKGVVQPRIGTLPLRPLTPATTLGFKCVAFARDVLGMEPDPWQIEFLHRALEITADGKFRYRTILLLVSRQNGKSAVCRMLTAWMIATGRAETAVSTAQDLGIARDLWKEVAEKAFENNDRLRQMVGAIRRANGQEALELSNGSRYLVKATTTDAARGLSVDLLLLDELRTHRSYGAYAALANTTIARPNPLTIGLSNAGDDTSVVLNELREQAIAQVDAGTSLGIFEWSAPDGCALDDLDAIRQANPSLGNGRLSMPAIEAAMAAPPNVFRTENLCQRVESLDSAVSAAGWKGGVDGAPGQLVGRTDLAAVWDVSPDTQHVTLVVAGKVGGKVRVEVAGAWDSTELARIEIPRLLDLIKPLRTGWFPDGPGGALAPIMKGRRRVVRISNTESAKACMGLADLARTSGVLHANDPLLNAHVIGSTRLKVVDGWRFQRTGGGHCDAAYAAAGAVHLILTERRLRDSGGEGHTEAA